MLGGGEEDRNRMHWILPYNYAAGDAVDHLDAITASIPGVPREDYTIYAEVPESGFVCDAQDDGSYYADPET